MFVSGDVFSVCFGVMPAKVLLFNLRGETVYDFGSGPRNTLHFDPFGRLLCIAGFGNLSQCRIEVWDLRLRTAPRLVANLASPNTTHFEWSPTGLNFLCATTSPRLKVDNRYRVYSFAGEAKRDAQFDVQAPAELYDVRWRPLSLSQRDAFRDAPLEYKSLPFEALLKQPTTDGMFRLLPFFARLSSISSLGDFFQVLCSPVRFCCNRSLFFLLFRPSSHSHSYYEILKPTLQLC